MGRLAAVSSGKSVNPMGIPMMEETCPECCESLDYLDKVVNKITRTAFNLYICHNEDCPGYELIYNDRASILEGGDPSGCYG